jgi:hypothetical protein
MFDSTPFRYYLNLAEYVSCFAIMKSMQSEEIVRRLRQQGHQLGRQVVNSDGQICWLVDGCSSVGS